VDALKIMKVIYVVSGLLYLIFILFYNLLGDVRRDLDGIFWINLVMIILFILLLPFLFKNLTSALYQELGFYFILGITCLVCILTWLVNDFSVFFQFILLLNMLTAPVSLNMYKIYFCLLLGLVSFTVRFFFIFYRDDSYDFETDRILNQVQFDNLRFNIVVSSIILGMVLFVIEIW
jgi:hypothetical protein